MAGGQPQLIKTREFNMNINNYIKKIKSHPDYHKAGMILCHTGVVRETSGQNGKKVDGLKVSVDHEKLAAVLGKYRQTPGIVEILVEIAENRPLAVGDDVMVLVVAGDVRKNVLAVLSDTLNEIKSTVVSKVENFV